MRHTRVLGHTLLGLALLAGTLAVAACGTSSGASAPTATPAVTPTTSGLTGYPIKVYFSNNPGTLSVTPVNRVSPTSQVQEFSLQMLIAGPTPEERATGLFSELNDAFNGGSNCAGSLPVDGPDFTLSLNMKGTTPAQGVATVRFCRATTLPGEGTGFRIGAEIDATLMQFPGVTKVIILDMAGNCWSGVDLRGGNACLQ
ncbi:MAG TPA: hypothetical protein VMV29_10825 [Ktedonobacterales bacterium]|nr:hypothetical protein [Ktedonobacterales bacterium]